MRSCFVFAALVSLAGCGAADDQGYCIGPYDAGFAADFYDGPAYEGTGCLWARKSACDDAGGDWVDFVDTEFDYSGEGTEMVDYCASEGFTADCGEAELFMAAAEDCPS